MKDDQKEKDQKKAKAKIRELVDKIRQWNYAYYVLNAPLVPDSVYDQHFQELKALELVWPSLKLKNSPTTQVGNQLEKQQTKIAHQQPMLSLDNLFNEAEFSNFVKRVNKVTAQQHSYHCEPKIDGLPVAFVFKNNFFDHAATRGNGFWGENVTENVKQIKILAPLLTKKQPLSNFELRGEIFMNKKDFLQLNYQIYQNNLAFLQKKIAFLKAKWKKELEIAFPAYLFLYEKKTSFDQPVLIVFSDNLAILSSQTKLFSHQIETTFQLTFWGKDSLSAYQLIKTFFATKLNQKQPKLTLLSPSSPAFSSTKQLTLSWTFFITFPENQFVNPRNAASGSLRNLEPAITGQRKLNIHFYSLWSAQLKTNLTQLASLKKIAKMGFPINPEGQFCHDQPTVLAYIKKLQNKREALPYKIDGVVIKINEHQYYPLLSTTSHHVNYWIAYKFPEKTVETKLLAIFPTLGRTGKITYNAKLEATFLSDSKVQAATLHNAQYIKSLDIREGDFVYIKKAGDIIPKVVAVNKAKRAKDLVVWQEDQYCFACNKELVIANDEVDQYCLNFNCQEKKIRSLLHFASREAMNIVGLSVKTVRKFYQLKLITQITDIYWLEKELNRLFAQSIESKTFWIACQRQFGVTSPINQLKKDKGWGYRSFYNLWQAIYQSRKNNYLDKILFGLNIRHLGMQSAKILTKHFHNIDILSKVQEEELILINEIGPILAKSIVTFFAQPEIQTLITTLKEYQLNLFALSTPHFLSLKDKKIAITGSFDWPRKVIISHLEKQGATITASLSANTDFLFVGTQPGNKLQLAIAKKITIYDQKKLAQFLNF